MFFTVKKIDGFVISIDEFDNDQVLLKQVVEFLSPNYKLSFVSQIDQADYTRIGISEDDVFGPKTAFEALMFQNIIRRAIIHMGTKPSTTAFLCRRANYLRNAHEILLGTIVMVPPNATDQQKLLIFQEFPDFLVNGIQELQHCLSGTNVGFGGEYWASPSDAFIFDHKNVKTCQFPQVPNTEHPDCPVYVAGRYFGFSDPRHSLHALSTRIVRSKSNPSAQAKCFAHLYINGALWATGNNIDLITRVPPRPGDDDRLAVYMNEIPKTKTFREKNLKAEILNEDILKCIRKYPKLKTLNYQQRKAAVSGAFEVNGTLHQKHIVLLDDVQTTGATLNECIRILKGAGASKITPLVLGYHPYALQTLGLTDDHELHCLKCKATLISRCNKTDGSPFYGCSGWRPNDGTAHTMSSFAEGRKQKLKLMEAKVMQLDEELQSENIWF